MKQIPVFRPLLEEEELEAARQSLQVGWLGMGADVAEFEGALAELLEIRTSQRKLAAVSTGHAALHLALLLCGVGSGDEVITASFNNVADFQAIIAVGASPVFCDIDPNSLCIDAKLIERLIGPRTRAIIATDYACQICDHDAIAAIARRHNLRVIHDAAHAIGSRYNGVMAGNIADVSVFSFDPVKTITTIDGGAIVVRDEENLRKIHEMRLIGMAQPSSVMYRNRRAWTYDVSRLGFRYHLANLHAAIGVAQLKKFGRIAMTRRESFAHYAANLRDITGVMTATADLAGIVPFIFYIRVLNGRRDALRDHLAQCGVDTGVHWQPGHWFSLFSECRRGDLTITERVGGEILTLPFYSAMEKDVQDRVIDAVRKFSW